MIKPHILIIGITLIIFLGLGCENIEDDDSSKNLYDNNIIPQCGKLKPPLAFLNPAQNAKPLCSAKKLYTTTIEKSNNNITIDYIYENELLIKSIRVKKTHVSFFYDVSTTTSDYKYDRQNRLIKLSMIVRRVLTDEGLPTDSGYKENMSAGSYDYYEIYEYDNSNQLLSVKVNVTYPEYKYDNKLIYQADYSYNEKSQLYTMKISNNDNESTNTYTYLENGLLETIAEKFVNKDKNGNSQDKTTTYTYNTENQIIKETVTDINNEIKQTYDYEYENSKLMTLTSTDYSSESSQPMIYEYKYTNSTGLLESYTVDKLIAIYSY